MKLSIFNLSILALGATAQSQAFRNICPSLDNGRSYEISPGYHVEYKCNTLGPYGGAPVAATSAKACADICKARSGCTGSSWLSTLNLCYVSGNNAQTAYANAIYLKQVRSTGPADLQSCRTQLATLQSQLATCRTTNSNYDICQGKTNGETFETTIGNRKYRTVCGRVSTSGTNVATIRNVATTSECAVKCNEVTAYKCTQALFQPSTRSCVLRRTGEKVLPTGRYAYNTMQLIE